MCFKGVFNKENAIIDTKQSNWHSRDEFTAYLQIKETNKKIGCREGSPMFIDSLTQQIRERVTEAQPIDVVVNVVPRILII